MPDKRTLCLGGAAHGRLVPGSAGTLYIPYAYCYSPSPGDDRRLFVPFHWWAYSLVLVHFPEDYPKTHHYYLWDRLHGEQVDWDSLKDDLPAGTAWLKPVEACA